MKRPRLYRLAPSGGLLALVATAPPEEDTEPPSVVDVEPQQPPPAERTPSDQTLDPPEGGVPFTMPMFFLEGWTTSDDRYWEPGTVGRRDLPQTLMAMRRNPDGGFMGHDAAIINGRIDTMERYDASAELNRETGKPFGDGVYAWRATGWLIGDTEETASTIRYVRDGVLRGVSVDLAEATAELDVLEEDEDGWPERVRIRFTQSSIAQATLTPFAAFPGAYIELDEETEPPAAPPVVPAAQAIRTTSPRALLASAGPAPLAPPREWFDRVQIDNPSRHVYVERAADGTPTGRCYGYVAEWGVAHIGIRDARVTAPKLGEEGYRLLNNSGTTITADGGVLPCGRVTLGGGHPSLTLGVIPAMAHYDDAGLAVANVRFGEDDFGVWFAGAFRPSTTREQIEHMAGQQLSGDWRADYDGDQVRLVAALCVNTGGYPIGVHARLAASGAVMGLVGAGSAPLRVKAERATAGGTDLATVQAAIDRATRPLLASAARSALDRLTRDPHSR
jgi:hypothetical protein